MLTPCWPSAGPTGGAGVACPPEHWSLTFALTTFAIINSNAGSGMRNSGRKQDGQGSASRLPDSPPRTRLDPFHLPVFEVHRRRPVEDDQHDLDEAPRRDDLLDGPLEVLEGA